jgi:hypothetical protein
MHPPPTVKNSHPNSKVSEVKITATSLTRYYTILEKSVKPLQS